MTLPNKFPGADEEGWAALDGEGTGAGTARRISTQPPYFRAARNNEQMGSEARVEITAANDILTARQRGRALAAELGFSGSEAALIAAAIAEVSRNIVEYAQRGEVVFDCLVNGRRRGLQIVARDKGPGIADVQQAMQYGFSTGHGLGVGLPGARWLMDEFEIQSSPGEGTTVTMKKWVSQFGKQTHKNAAGN
jgi:serine/threonine-protein kinase RsbT